MWDGVRCQWQPVLVKVSERHLQLPSLCRIGGHALTHNIRWELRWKKGQESNTEKTRIRHPRLRRSSQSGKQNQAPKPEAELGNALKEPKRLWKNIHLWLYIYMCDAYREWNIYAITHASNSGSRDCSVFDIYTRTLFCFHEVEPRGCHTRANVADKNK